MKQQYILVLKKETTDAQFDELIKKFDITVVKHFDQLTRHYIVSFDENKKQEIKNHPIVIHATEEDAPVQLTGIQQIQTSFDASGDNWGLARIASQDSWNDAGWFPVHGEYKYSRTGEGVDAYVVDTGVRATHVDFEGRVEHIFDYYANPGDASYGEDTQGHGTHVASTIGGKKYGVAKKVRILNAKIFDGDSATLAAVISGINAVLAHHNDKKATSVNRPSVMNLSIGGPKVTIEEQALNDCIEAGIVIAAAAGNDGKNLDDTTYNILPAEIARAITVGAVDVKDRIASYSNYGSTVDLFGPGSYIAAAYHNNDNAESVISGTSMACPHAAGVLVLKVQGENIGTDATFVKVQHDWMVDNATVDTILLHEAANNTLTPNKMLFNPFTLTHVEETFDEVVAGGSAVEEPIIIPEPVNNDHDLAKGRFTRNRWGRKQNPKLDKMVKYYKNKISQLNTPQSNVTELESAYEAILASSEKQDIINSIEAFFAVKRQLDRM